MEETTNPTTKSISMKWGVIYGLVGIIFLVVVDFAGMMQNRAVSWIGYLILGALIFMAHKEYKSEGDGYMSYSKGLGIGTLTTLIGGIINSLFFFVYISFINTEFVNLIKEKSIMDMEARGMSDAEIDQAMGFSEAFMSPVAMTIFSILGTVLFGFILSLIVSIFTKNNQPEGI
ncbi:Protein of unknown function [Ekhidna lutea]|uniref:DUF4199 domain-containing protein n=1 Tax=Ekhidna lutea TaxID=447679 RepID=A0A239K7X4_EKHLU|nr:DUF4199 domain-containing protein [Ekhidna lutea]SNT13743.1 Protein of unknown function [Ekhidna lutea]